MRRDERHNTMKSGVTGGGKTATSGGTTGDGGSSVTSAKVTVKEDANALGAGQSDFSVLSMILHPTTVPRQILQSVAGNYWPACSRQLTLLPLSFNDPELERYFIDFCQERMPFRIYIVCVGFIVTTILSWSLVSISNNYNWFELIDDWVIPFNHIVTAGCLVLTVTLMMVCYLKKPQALYKRLEVTIFVTQFLYTFLLSFWGTLAIYRTSKLIHFEELRRVVDHQYYIFGFPLYTIIIYVYAIYKKYFFELKSLADAITTALFFMQIITIDTYFDTRSSLSIWFHISMVGVFSLTRGLQMPGLFMKQLKAANILDMGFITLVYLVGWSARWFRELQERSNIVRVKESQSRLQSVKDRSKKRKVGISAAEEILDILKQTTEIIKEINKIRMRKGNGPNSLLEVLDIIQSATDMLASVESKTDQTTQDQATFDPTKADDDLKEDAFINMFRLDKAGAGGLGGLGGAGGAGGRKPRGVVAAGGGGVKWLDEQEEGGGGAGGAPGVVRYADVDIKVPTQLEKIGRDIGSNFDLRILEISQNADNIVMDVGYILLAPFKQFLDCADKQLLALLFAIHQNHSPKNPYHSSIHGANVAHLAFCILNSLNMSDYCTEEQLVGMALAGVGHSLGHSGRNNLFYIQSDSALTVLQNDGAVLENVQCFMLQTLITSCPEVNILANLSREEFITVRKAIIDLILSLDMSRHFEIISKSRVRRASPEFDIMNDDREMALQIIFKTADIGHCMLDWPQQLEWSLRLQEEYYQQGADEFEKGLQMSPLCDRSKHSSIPKTQSGYISIIMIPMIEELVNYDQGNSTIVELMTKTLFNKQKWDGLKDNKKSPPIPTEYQTQTATSKYTLWIMLNVIKSSTFKDLCQQPTVQMIARV